MPKILTTCSEICSSSCQENLKFFYSFTLAVSSTLKVGKGTKKRLHWEREQKKSLYMFYLRLSEVFPNLEIL